MSDIAIRVENLSKQYHIGRARQRHDTLRDSLVGLFSRERGNGEDDTFWALRDVSFEVKRGEVVGIIGRNGAGKSTLLKILSQITEPTGGRAEIHGRVGSLLEVGTGFHPELTGRENIYLNGAILGMRRAEIQRRFDEIVAFAEIEKFLDTPVKRYSSGMYVRLAFAVAAHLEPEILLVDEVLAVGDISFQQKCLGKMGDVARQGRTVLFVSHNMVAVRSLCSNGLLVESGTVLLNSTTNACIDTFYRLVQGNQNSSWTKDGSESDESPLVIQSASVNIKGEQPRHELVLDICLESRQEHKSAFIAVDILDTINGPLMQALPSIIPFVHSSIRRHKVKLTIELPPLIPGRYSLTIWVGSHNTETFDLVDSNLSFNITDSPSERRSFPHTIDHGHIVPRSRVEYLPFEARQLTDELLSQKVR